MLEIRSKTKYFVYQVKDFFYGSEKFDLNCFLNECEDFLKEKAGVLIVYQASFEDSGRYVIRQKESGYVETSLTERFPNLVFRGEFEKGNYYCDFISYSDEEFKSKFDLTSCRIGGN